MQSASCLSTVAPAVVVVPCFNEEERLSVARWAEVASELHLVCVDDGSKDRTLDVLRALAEAAPGRVTVISLSRNSGKAEAVRTGFLHAISLGARVVGFADADLATPVHEIVRLARSLKSSAVSAVLGSRRAESVERDRIRGALGRVFAWTASRVLGSRFDDTQCGAKFFRVGASLREAVAMPFSSPWSFDVELLLRLMRGRADAGGVQRQLIVEVPLAEWSDVPGSKLTARAAIRAGLELLTLRHAVDRWSRELEDVPPPPSTVVAGPTNPDHPSTRHRDGAFAAAA